MEENVPKKKGGRPRKSEGSLRLRSINLRTTEASYQHLKATAELRRQSVADLVRTMCNDGQVVVINAEQETLLRQIAGLAVNLNQLTRQAHQGGYSTAAAAMGQVVQRINELLDQWKDDCQS